MIDRYDEVNVEKIMELNLVNDEEFDSSSDWNLCEVYIDDELTDGDKLELISKLDFEVSLEDRQFKLRDLQGANLCDIESERFDSLDEIIERLDNYWYDAGICIIDREMFNLISKDNTNQTTIIAEMCEEEVSDVWAWTTGNDTISFEVELSDRMYVYNLYDSPSGNHKGLMIVPLAPEQARKFMKSITNRVSSAFWVDTLEQFASAIGGTIEYTASYESLVWNE